MTLWTVALFLVAAALNLASPVAAAPAGSESIKTLPVIPVTPDLIWVVGNSSNPDPQSSFLAYNGTGSTVFMFDVDAMYTWAVQNSLTQGKNETADKDQIANNTIVMVKKIHPEKHCDQLPEDTKAMIRSSGGELHKDTACESPQERVDDALIEKCYKALTGEPTTNGSSGLGISALASVLVAALVVVALF